MKTYPITVWDEFDQPVAGFMAVSDAALFIETVRLGEPSAAGWTLTEDADA